MARIFRTHHDAAIITSLTGIGDVLGAEFLAVVGGSLAGFASADHLAGYAGLAPAPHDSGYRTGNLHRPQRSNRQLQRVFYTSAMISIQHSPASKAYYNGKRAQGKRHTQAVLALARRRVNVLCAMLRDHRPLPRTTAVTRARRLTTGLRISCRLTSFTQEEGHWKMCSPHVDIDRHTSVRYEDYQSIGDTQ